MSDSKDFISIVGGRISNLALHQERLDGGDYAAVVAQAKKGGLTEEGLIVTLSNRVR